MSIRIHRQLTDAGHQLASINTARGLSTYYCERCGAIAVTGDDKLQHFQAPMGSESNPQECFTPYDKPSGWRPTLQDEVDRLSTPESVQATLKSRVRQMAKYCKMYAITKEAFVADVGNEFQNPFMARLLHQACLTVPNTGHNLVDSEAAKSDLTEEFAEFVATSAEALIDGRIVGGTFEPLCSTCKTPFENIEHPLKPGVIMQRRCKCEVSIYQIPGGTVTVLSPPKAE